MIFQGLQNRYDYITAKLTEVERELPHLPPGRLICGFYKGHPKYYLSSDKVRTYLSSKDATLIQQLSYKKYLLALQKDLLAEKKALSPYIEYQRNLTCQSEKLLYSNSQFPSLLSPYIMPVSTTARQWMEAPFESNPNYHEHLIYKTNAGIYVRSKSEALIVSLLVQYQIPFRYECPLPLDGIIYYPDFTIMHPKTGRFYYWEHLGLLDKETYLKDNASKLQHFIKNGIIPTQQLIITCETKENPLDLNYVDNLIHFYFL